MPCNYVGGYKTNLDVPIPEGEERLDIRIPELGDRILETYLWGHIPLVVDEKWMEEHGRLIERYPNLAIRIILKSKPRPRRFMNITIEIPASIGHAVVKHVRLQSDHGPELHDAIIKSIGPIYEEE